MESAPADEGERRATAGTARRPLTTPPPCTRGLFCCTFYKNTALYLSHLRGGAAIRQNFTTFRRRAGFSRQAIHGMIEPCTPLRGVGRRRVLWRRSFVPSSCARSMPSARRGSWPSTMWTSTSKKANSAASSASPAAANQPAQPAGRAGKTHARPGVHRQARDQRHERGPARPFPPGAPWLHFPELQPAAQHDGGRKRRPAADVQGRARQTAAGAGPQRAQEHGPGRPRQPPAHRDERRPAAARGHRARLCQPPQGHFCRRTDRQPRFDHDPAGAVPHTGNVQAGRAPPS